MSTLFVPDHTESLLFVPKDDNQHGGYQKQLFRQLSILEEIAASCTYCENIFYDVIVSDGNLSCYTCGINTKDCKRVPELSNYVEKLDVRCPLFDRGCKWDGRLANIEEHLKECCYFVETCPLECSAVLPRFQIEEHVTSQCPLRLISCDFCEESVQEIEMDQHLTECQMLPIPCEQGCDQTILRRDNEYHINEICGLTLICCPYAAFGCECSEFRRSELMKHLFDDFLQHTNLFLYQYHRQQEQIDNQEQMIQKFRNNFNDTLKKQQLSVSTIIDKVANIGDENTKLTNLTRNLTSKVNFTLHNTFIWEISEVKDHIKRKYASISFPTQEINFYKFNGYAYFTNTSLEVFLSRTKGNSEDQIKECVKLSCQVTLVNKYNNKLSWEYCEGVKDFIADDTSVTIANIKKDKLLNPDFNVGDAITIVIKFVL